MAYRTTVYDSRLADLFKKTSSVARFSERFAAKVIAIAAEPGMTPRQIIPDPRPWKSEDLVGSNRHRGYLRAGLFLGQIVLENTASYAVHAWRRPSVHTRGKKRMQVPRVHVGGGAGFVYLRKVASHYDQKRHWLERATYKAALKFR